MRRDGGNIVMVSDMSTNPRRLLCNCRAGSQDILLCLLRNRGGGETIGQNMVRRSDGAVYSNLGVVLQIDTRSSRSAGRALMRNEGGSRVIRRLYGLADILLDALQRLKGRLGGRSSSASNTRGVETSLSRSGAGRSRRRRLSAAATSRT